MAAKDWSGYNSYELGTLYAYANGSEYGKYKCTVYWQDVVRNGTTVTINDANLYMYHNDDGSKYTTNRIAMKAGVGGSQTNIKDNFTINPYNTRSKGSYTISLGNPSTTTTGTTVDLYVAVGSTGGSSSWGNWFGNSPISKTITMSCPEATTYVECWENSKTPNSINVGWMTGDTADYIWYSTNGGSSWTAVGSVDSIGGSFNITGLSADTTYSIKVRARRKDTGVDTNYSPAVSMKTYKAYSYVTSCTVGNIMPFTCTAYCTSSNASNTSAYEYTLCNSNKQAITTVSSSTTSQNWSGLSEETTYYMRCRVQSSDSGVWSDYVYSSAFTTLVDQAKGYIKYGGSWHLGKVYMKINGTWTKAKKAYLKSGGIWTISRNP